MHIYIYKYIYAFLPLFIYCRFYYVHLFLENSSIFPSYFFETTFWYYFDHHILKKLQNFSQLILEMFLYLLRAVKPFLIKVCKDAFCITPMLTALRNIFTANLLVEAILGYFLVCLAVFFSISLEPFGFL